MKDIVLFWNHICILHGFEKKFLEKLKTKLLDYNINLIIKYFGVGYEYHMSEYILNNDFLPDIIVSSDLEVFENKKIFDKLGSLYSCENWLPLKKTSSVVSVKKNEYLLPFVIIPLVLYGNTDFSNKNILDISTEFKISFGGINNSAGKTIVKSIWYKYGKENIKNILKNSTITNMPINSFQSTKINNTDCSIVPSIYSLTADNQSKFMSVSKDGPILLPSYFTVRKSINEEDAKTVCKLLFDKELLDFYSKNGDLINCTNISEINSSQENTLTQLFQSNNFINSLNSKDFYDLYCEYIPSAKRL